MTVCLSQIPEPFSHASCAKLYVQAIMGSLKRPLRSFLLVVLLMVCQHSEMTLAGKL